MGGTRLHPRWSAALLTTESQNRLRLRALEILWLSFVSLSSI